MSFVLRSKPVQTIYLNFHYYFLSEQAVDSTISNLSFETEINTSINRFRRHQWKLAEVLHYGTLCLVIFFVFIIFPASFLIKIPILAAFITCFLIPMTSQFFIHALPIFSWLALFFSASKIPVAWKPPISVKFLPAMETILYGDNLSNVLAATNNSFLDILAWLPYGIIHFSSPFIVALFIFLFAPPTSLNSFGFAFGYMNLAGVLIQLLFPAAAPWYKNLYALLPANYSMDGSPGGLGRIDQLFGVDMYTSTFQNSPLVFGAFPSLHSGCAVMDVLFLCWLFPKFQILWWSYACLLWWSTMYLTHHYFIDLVCGAALSFIVFTYVKYTQLPVIDPTRFCRWSYTEIHHLDYHANDPLTSFTPLRTDDENLAYFDLPRQDYEMETLEEPSGAPVPGSSNFETRGSSKPSSPSLEDTLAKSLEETDRSSNTSVFDGDEEANPLLSQVPSRSSLLELGTAAGSGKTWNP